MNDTKYIVYTDRDEIERMVIFSYLDTHADRARGLGLVISAGFISVGKDARCFGESISLGIKSRDRDTDLARWTLGWREYPPTS